VQAASRGLCPSFGRRNRTQIRGSLLATQNRVPEAEKLFARARRQEAELGYHEPPSYIRPVGETEAAAWLADGKWSESEAAYQQALTERPKSGFSLYGIALAEEGSGGTARTAAVYREFHAAWKTADAGLPQLEHARQWLSQHGAENDLN
jgi:predicted Zn-dependent protease